MSSAAVSEATTQPFSSRPSARGVQSALVHEDQGVRPADQRKDVQGGAFDTARAAAEERGEHLGVGGGAELSGTQAGGELRGVDEVAVVAERQTAVVGGPERR